MKTKSNTTKPSGGTRPEEMTMKQVRDLIHEEARKCAEKWFPLQCRKDWASFYLYYRTGELDVSEAEDAPAGWTLASAERLNPGDTRAQVAAKIATIAQRLPFLPVYDMLEIIETEEETAIRHLNDALDRVAAVRDAEIED